MGTPGIISIALLLSCVGCVTSRVSPATTAAPSTRSSDQSSAASEKAEAYTPVRDEAAALLGCAVAPASPACEVAMPTAEEDSAFRAEGTRLVTHPNENCRRLGEAILANRSSVRMYRKALIRWAGSDRLYGVGHAMELDEVWLVRVARSLDDLNERTLDEKKRTLRHEMSHTIGATETPGSGWTAEDFAAGCA